MYEDIYKRIVDECAFRNLSPGTVKQYVYPDHFFLDRSPG